MITTLSMLAIGIGVLALLRTVILVVAGSQGFGRLDPWISLVIGFGLIFLGQLLLRQGGA